MNSLGNKIFGSSDPLSREELEAYSSGQLSPEEMHALEERMAADPFSADAADGFAADPTAFAALDGLQAQFQEQLAQAAPTSSSFWTTSKLLISGAVMLGAGVGIYFLLQNPESSEIAEAQNTPNTVEEIDFTPEPELTIAEIDAAEPIAEEEQFTYEVALETQAPTTSTATSSSISHLELEDVNVTIVDYDTIAFDPVEEMEFIEQETVEEVEATTPTKVVQSNVMIAYIIDLKVVDYSDFYKTRIELYKLDYTHSQRFEHVDAQYETSVQQAENREDPDIITTYVPYADFLESAMKKFNQNDFGAALKDYRTILKFFPNDANAHFYGGLCYFNLGKNNKAVEYFDKVLENRINTFDQEALWYKTLIYIKRGHKKKATDLLEQIIAENGFYAERAQEELEKLTK